MFIKKDSYNVFCGSRVLWNPCWKFMQWVLSPVAETGKLRPSVQWLTGGPRDSWWLLGPEPECSVAKLMFFPRWWKFLKTLLFSFYSFSFFIPFPHLQAFSLPVALYCFHGLLDPFGRGRVGPLSSWGAGWSSPCPSSPSSSSQLAWGSSSAPTPLTCPGRGLELYCEYKPLVISSTHLPSSHSVSSGKLY